MSNHQQVPCTASHHRPDCPGYCDSCTEEWPCEVYELEIKLAEAQKDVAMLAAIRWVAQKTYDDEAEPIGRRGFAATVLNLLNGLEDAADHGYSAPS